MGIGVSFTFCLEYILKDAASTIGASHHDRSIFASEQIAKMLQFTALSLSLLGISLASPLSSRQSCPAIHIFGARETTAPAGYGTAGVVVNLVLNAYPGSTAEAINYPACGGQSSCGGVSYANSVQQGVAAVTAAVNAFNTKCPSTQLVIVGYSQVCSSRCLILESRLTSLSGWTNLRRCLLWWWRFQRGYLQHRSDHPSICRCPDQGSHLHG